MMSSKGHPPAERPADPASAAGADIDHRQIARLVPHRYPFQFVDRVLEFSDVERIVAVKNVSLMDPFFQGHFPGHPIMPGVLICEAMAQAGAILARLSVGGVPDGKTVVLSGLEGVRFRRPVVPGDQLRMEVTVLRHRRPLWRLHGVATVDGQLVAEGDILAMEVEWIDER